MKRSRYGDTCYRVSWGRETGGGDHHSGGGGSDTKNVTDKSSSRGRYGQHKNDKTRGGGVLKGMSRAILSMLRWAWEFEVVPEQW